MSIRRMMMFTLGGSLILTLIKNLKDFIAIRTLQLGTTFEAEPCLVTDLTDLDNLGLLNSATMILTPTNSSETEIAQVLPLPLSDIRNLLFRSEGTTASWGTLQVTQAVVAGTSPTGEPTIIKMTENAASNIHNRNQTVPNLTDNNGAFFVFSCYLKKGDGVGSPDIMQLGYSTAPYANFNIVTGASTASGGGVTSTSITDEGDGWWRCAIIGRSNGAPQTAQLVYITFVNNNPTATRLPSYLGAINRNTFMFGAQLELGTSLTPYQKVEITPQTTNNYTYFGNTSTPYRTDSNGLLTNSPYENLIYPSINLSSVSTGTAWRWLYNGLGRNVCGIPGPDGTLTGTILNVGSLSRNDYYLTYMWTGNNINFPSFPTSRIRTIILYVKQLGTDKYLGLRLSSGRSGTNYTVNSYTIKIDCSDGTLSNNPTDYSITYTSQASTNGWYKVCITCDTAWDSIYLQTSSVLAIVTSVIGQGVGLWGIQVVNGTVDINTPIYNREIGYNMPRLDYSGSSCPEYLLESTNYNTLLQSEDFTAANWITSSVTVTPKTEIAPNGELVADTLTATSDFALIRQSGQANNSITLRRMFSVYLKRKTGTGDVIVDMGPASATASLSTGSWTRAFVLAPTLGGTYTATAGAYTITTTLPHGFETGDAIRYDRLTGTGLDASIGSITVTGLNEFTYSTGTVTSSGTCNIYSNTGKIRIQTNGDEVYAWGAQIESEKSNSIINIPSSYIPTTTAQVTKNGDFTATNISGSGAFTLYLEMSRIGGTAEFITIGNETNTGLSTDALSIVATGGGTISIARKQNSGANSFISNPLPYAPFDNTIFKLAISIDINTVNFWFDGSLILTTTFANPDLLKYLALNGGNSTDLRLSQIASWNSVLSNSDIASLTYNPYIPNGTSKLTRVVGYARSRQNTLPSYSTLQALDTFIETLITEGIWDKMDAIYNFAYNDIGVESFSRINLKTPGRATVTIPYGVVNYETNGYLNSTGVLRGFRPGVDFTNFQYYSHNRTYILYQNVDDAQIDRSSILADNFAMYNGNLNTHRDVSNTNLPVAVDLSGTGLKSVTRESSTSVTLYNGSVGTTLTQNATNYYGTSQQDFLSSSGLGAGFASFGGALAQTDIDTLRTAYNTYLTSIGLTAYA